MTDFIFRCTKSFKYTQHYISVILIAKNSGDAKNKFISKCLTEYDTITKQIDFKLFYDINEDVELPIKFDCIKEFENYLIINIEETDIECLGNCNFEIIDAYD